MLTTLPNLLTLSRICAIPVVIAAFYLETPWSNWVALAFFVGAGLTDLLDGHLARLFNQVSGFGRFLDPVADKLLVAATLLMLVHRDHITGLAIFPTLIILCREIMVSGLREYLAELRVGLPVSRLAKWKTVQQMVAIGFLIVGEAGWNRLPVVEIGLIGLWIAAGLTLYTGYDYLRLGLSHMGEEPPDQQAQPGVKPGASRSAAAE